MDRRSALVGIGSVSILAAVARAQQTDGRWLLTGEDVRLENEALARARLTPDQIEQEYERLLPKSGPGSPQIIVRAPDVGKQVRSPVAIRVDFMAAPDATIVPDSLKVKYGFIGLDITDRIRKHAQVAASGLVADVEDMPTGKHTFELSISDNLGRTTRQKFRCEVVK